MITTAVTLDRARNRWVFLGNAIEMFDEAARALDNATCQTDVLGALNAPDFTVRPHATASEVWEVLTNQQFMMAYTLAERNPDAEVEILP